MIYLDINTNKQIDLSNLEKALHDCLASAGNPGIVKPSIVYASQFPDESVSEGFSEGFETELEKINGTLQLDKPLEIVDGIQQYDVRFKPAELANRTLIHKTEVSTKILRRIRDTGVVSFEDTAYLRIPGECDNEEIFGESPLQDMKTKKRCWASILFGIDVRKLAKRRTIFHAPEKTFRPEIYENAYVTFGGIPALAVSSVILEID